MKPRWRERSTHQLVRIVASAALVIGATGIAVAGGRAAAPSSTLMLRATTSAPCSRQPAGAVCPVDITLSGDLGRGATGLVPADEIARPVTIANTGRTELSAVTLSIVGGAGSPLVTDPHGLEVRVERCPSPWVEGAASTYTCAHPSTRVAWTKVAAARDLDLGNLSAFQRGGSDHLLATIRVPAAAPPSIAGKSTTLAYEFTAVQRTTKGKSK